MTALERRVNMAAVFLPFAVTAAAIPSFGESWHHNHHAFPRSAAHGLKWWEIDPSAMVIAGMKRVGLAWDVVKIAPERQAQKLVGAKKPEPVAKPAEEKVAEPVA